MVFLTISIPENNGPAVTALGKLEINPPAVLAGLSELQKPWATDSALLQAKNSKPESQLKTCSLAAGSLVEMDATVVTSAVLGASSRTAVLSLVTCMETTNGANLTSSLLATTTPPVNMDLAEPASPPPNARSLVSTEKPTPPIKSSLPASTQFPEKPKWWLKSSPTDPSK